MTNCSELAVKEFKAPSDSTRAVREEKTVQVLRFFTCSTSLYNQRLSMLFTVMCLCVFVGWKCVKLLHWLKTCQRFFQIWIFQIWILSHRQQRTRTSLTELNADELLLFYCNLQRCDVSSSWIVGLSWKSQRILLVGLLIHSDKDFCCVMDGSHWENTSHHCKTWTRCF